MAKRMNFEAPTDPETIEAGLETRRKYYREYQTKNKDRRTIIMRRYWEKRSRLEKETENKAV